MGWICCGWWRFLAAVDVVWDRASRIEARDFSCWIQATAKPRRSNATSSASGKAAGAANPVTGKPSPDTRYAVATVAHSNGISLMSAPAAKARSEPVMRMAPMLLSVSSSSTAVTISRRSWVFNALSAFGRLRVLIPTRPLRSRRMVS